MNDDEPAYKYEIGNYSADDEEKHIPVALESSFHEFMENQIGLLDLNDRQEINKTTHRFTR